MANKKKPAPISKTKTAQAKKKKPIAVNQKSPKPVEPSAPKSRADGREILRRAAIAALAVVLVFGIALTVDSMRGELLQNKITLVYSGVLQQESLFSIEAEDDWVHEGVRATKRHGQTRAFTCFCNDTLQLNEANMTGYIYFGNPVDNDCTLVLSVFDKNNTLLYRSGGVEPGKYVTQIRPFYVLAKGTYPCTAYISAYAGRDQDYRCVGVQYMHLTVKVGETS